MRVRVGVGVGVGGRGRGRGRRNTGLLDLFRSGAQLGPDLLGEELLLLRLLLLRVEARPLRSLPPHLLLRLAPRGVAQPRQLVLEPQLVQALLAEHALHLRHLLLQRVERPLAGAVVLLRRGRERAHLRPTSPPAVGRQRARGAAARGRAGQLAWSCSSVRSRISAWSSRR